MSSTRLRRWVLRGAASVTIVPTLVALNLSHGDPSAKFAAPVVTTSTTGALRSVEAPLTPITTTTVAPPPTTVATIPPAPRVTAPPVTTAPRVIAASSTIEERGAAALALINFPWQRLGYRVVIYFRFLFWLRLPNPVRRHVFQNRDQVLLAVLAAL